jgi:L-iditol 2-dehydrogenase
MSHTTTQIDAAYRPIGSLGHMRAGVYRGKGRVVVESVPVPEIGEGEVLFRVAACGICGTDIKKIEHGYVAPPQILGHELAGTVVKVGAGVKKFKAGDRVMSFHHVPCGSSSRSARGTRRPASPQDLIPTAAASLNMSARCPGLSNAE